MILLLKQKRNDYFMPYLKKTNKKKVDLGIFNKDIFEPYCIKAKQEKIVVRSAGQVLAELKISRSTALGLFEMHFLKLGCLGKKAIEQARICVEKQFDPVIAKLNKK